MLQMTQGNKEWNYPLWTDDQKAEMVSRCFVREAVGELLGDQLPSETLQELKEVLFDIVYPTWAKEAEER